MLKIENIKLPPGAGMAELTAEAARLLRVKEFVSLRVLRRSIDARDGVQLVYTVEAIVKDEAGRTAPVPQPEGLPDGASQALCAARSDFSAGDPAGGGGAGPGGLFAALCWPRPSCAPFCSSGAVPWSSAGRMWSGACMQHCP